MRIGVYNWADAGVHQTTDVLARIRLRRPLAGIEVYRNGVIDTRWHSAVWDWCRRHFVEARPCDKAALRRLDLAGVVTFGAPAWYVSSLQRHGRIVWNLDAVADPQPLPFVMPTGVYVGGERLVDQRFGHTLMLQGAAVGELREDGRDVVARIFCRGHAAETRAADVGAALAWADSVLVPITADRGA